MKIHGAGCSLVDNLYSPVDFSSRSYRKWLSRDAGKAGLITGGLVFGSDLEKSFGRNYRDIIGEITGNMEPVRNIGGPSIVALIHLAQVLNDTNNEISYFGARSDDEAGRYIIKQLSGFNIDTTSYLITRGGTPFTDVLSDPSYNEQNGERTFINYIGAAGELTGKDLPETFYNAEILILGGTALTPGIHDDLSSILKKGKTRGCLCFVNTVYDFRNQNKDPGRPWPLVEKNEDFKLIDLIIADNEEAFRITGKTG